MRGFKYYTLGTTSCAYLFLSLHFLLPRHTLLALFDSLSPREFEQKNTAMCGMSIQERIETTTSPLLQLAWKMIDDFLHSVKEKLEEITTSVDAR